MLKLNENTMQWIHDDEIKSLFEPSHHQM